MLKAAEIGTMAAAREAGRRADLLIRPEVSRFSLTDVRNFDAIVAAGYASGREADWMLTGFSPRKRELTLYLMSGFERFARLLAGLGKHRTGKGCLYLRSLEDIQLPVLEEALAGGPGRAYSSPMARFRRRLPSATSSTALS